MCYRGNKFIKERQMKQQKVILITGMPGAGKTTLVKELQKQYPNTVAVSVDLIQESLYDTLGFTSPDERRKLKAAAFKIALDEATDYLEQGLVPLLEYPFCDRHKEMLTSALKNKNILNLRLDLPLEEAYRRFHERDLSGKRHPGHYFQSYPPKDGDKPAYQIFEDYKSAMHRTHTPEFEMGRTLKIDATHFPLPMDKICAFIENSTAPQPNMRTRDGR
jgi:predicted kinase